MWRRSDSTGRAFVIAIDDPRALDVRELLEQHLAFAYEHSPAEDVHTLDLAGLLDPAVSFCSARRAGTLLGVTALRELAVDHGEVKSMHTAAAARGNGVGKLMLDHLLEEARARGYRRVSLETGSTSAFAPARALYRRAGFTPCAPFGNYFESPNSVCMTLVLA